MRVRPIVTISTALLLCGVGAQQVSASAALPTPRCRGVVATIVGTNRSDRLVGTAGRDVVLAGRGWDHVSGLGGNDLICGGPGADHLYDGAGADRVYGGADGLLFDEDQYGDVLVDGPGNDVLDGGPGLYGTDRGLDKLRFDNAHQGVVVDLAARFAIVNGNKEHIASFEDVAGSRYADKLYGDAAYQSMSGLAGDDTIVGRGRIDFLYAGTGNDELRGGLGDDYLQGGAGTDTGRGGPNWRFGDNCDNVEVERGCEH